MSANLLSLPSTIFTIIWDFCGAREILALSLTCRMFRTAVASSMLVVDGRCRSWSFERDIPIFFSDQCHSIYLTCYVYSSCEGEEAYRVIVLSRRRHQNGDFDKVVWEKTKPSKWRTDVPFYISFRSDPSHEYCIRIECTLEVRYEIQVRKQFMTMALTPAMKGALTACLDMGYIRREAWRPIQSLCPKAKERRVTRFFMKLCILSFHHFSGESPVSSLFESSSMPGNIHLLQREIISIFEQTFEQKEQIDCVKRPLSPNEEYFHLMEPNSSDCPLGIWESRYLPSLFLKEGFRWKREKSKHTKGKRTLPLFDQEETIRSKDGLVFIARIPLAPKTTGFVWCPKISTHDPTSLFVAFFHKRLKSGVDELANPIDGKVFAGQGPFHVDVKPEYESCYIYFVPGDESTMELLYVQVQLLIGLDEHNRDLLKWMELLLKGCWCETAPFYHRLFPITLFRACALALMGPNKEQCTSLKEAFDVEGFDSTPEGLQCIIQTCNGLLQE